MLLLCAWSRNYCCITLPLFFLCLRCVFVTYYNNPKNKSTSKYLPIFQLSLSLRCDFITLFLSLSRAFGKEKSTHHLESKNFGLKAYLFERVNWVCFESLLFPTSIHLEWFCVRAKKRSFFHLSEWSRKKGKTHFFLHCTLSPFSFVNEELGKVKRCVSSPFFSPFSRQFKIW